LGHVKPVIKKKAEDCLLLIFEVGENFDESIDTLNALLKHKNIKVLQSGTSAVALIVENFGVKKVKIGDYAKNMLANA
jgi:CO dehydrogenase/acetyl-CoA synthase epsilon subunit